MLKSTFRIGKRFSFSLVRLYSQNTLDRNKTIYSVLKPYLDFDEKLENLEKLENNINLRGLDIKLHSLITKWKHYKNVKDDVKNLEKERIRIADELAQIKASADAEKIKSLKFSGVNVREDLRKLKVVLSELEEQLYPQVLQLPNDITDNYNEVLYSKEIQLTDFADHLQVGHDLRVLEYTSPKMYFLKGPAAVFELAVCNKVANLFIKKDFIQFSNPDFTRNSIVECLKLNDIQTLLSLKKHHDDEEVDRLHLHGGASILPFCCYHSKTVTDGADLPLQYVTKGRHYAQSQQPGLYGVWQNTSVQIFVGSKEETINDHVNPIVKILTDFYASFDIPLRIIYMGPNNLSNSEKMRISFQTYSGFYKQHIELGHLSLYGDYISKRMRIYYSNNPSNKFLHIISGTVFKFPPLFAVILENKKDCTANYFLLNKDSTD